MIQKTVRSPLPQVLTPQEMQAVLMAADAFRRAPKPDLRHFMLVRLLLSTGIKKIECLNLHPNHIHLDAADGPYLFVRYASPAHRFKERKIPLPADWVEAYPEYARRYNLDRQVFPWSPRRLEYLLEDLSNAAGLEKHLSFSMCRWTCALNDWLSGMEAEKIRQKLGVSKIQWRELSQKLMRLAAQHDETMHAASGEDAPAADTP
ncbi:MAG: site-specific integrase [Anaerolineae bacterium]|nr:MAG: site-specific integrase [Anaerolineae bacterium]